MCRDRNTFCFELYVMYTFEFITTTAHSGLRKREVVAAFYTAVGVTTFNSLLSPSRYVCMLGWLTPVSHHLYKGDIPENLLKHSERAQISAHSHSSNLLVKWCGSDGCDKYHRQLLGRVPRKPTVVYFFVSTWISSENHLY